MYGERENVKINVEIATEISIFRRPELLKVVYEMSVCMLSLFCEPEAIIKNTEPNLSKLTHNL